MSGLSLAPKSGGVALFYDSGGFWMPAGGRLVFVPSALVAMPQPLPPLSEAEANASHWIQTIRAAFALASLANRDVK
jgi:hypothetical protein